MTDYNTLQRKRNYVVGVFVVLAACALIWLVFIFGELPTTFTEYRSYVIKVKFPKVPGVQINTPVQFCGYHIGRVIDIDSPKRMTDAEGNSYHQVAVGVAIEKKYTQIPADVDIKLMKRGLGSSYIEFIEPIGEPTEFLREGMMIQGRIGTGNEFISEDTQKKIDTLGSKVSELLASVNEIVGDKENKNNIRTSLANIANVTAQANETLKELQEFSAAGTRAMESTDAEIGRVSESIVTATEELSDTVVQLRIIMEKVNTGEGTLARLLNDGRLYENLIDSTEELQLSIENIKKLIGKTEKTGLKLKIF